MLFKLISDPVTLSQSEPGLATVLASLTLSDICVCVCVCLLPPVHCCHFCVHLFAHVCCWHFLCVCFYLFTVGIFCAFVSTCLLLAFFVHLFPHVCCWHLGGICFHMFAVGILGAFVSTCLLLAYNCTCRAVLAG